MITIKLKSVLENEGISMSELHRRSGISKNTLSLLSTGSSKGIQFETLDKILEHLSVNVQDIIVFSSKKEIEGLTVSIAPIGEVQHEAYTDGVVPAPDPPQADGESQLSYEARIEKLEELIGEYMVERFAVPYKVTIKKDSFSFSFEISVDWYTSYLYTDTEELWQNYRTSKYAPNNATKLDLEKYLSSYDDRQVNIFIHDLHKNLSMLKFSDYQIKESIRQLEELVKDAAPKSYINLLEEKELLKAYQEYSPSFFEFYY